MLKILSFVVFLSSIGFSPRPIEMIPQPTVQNVAALTVPDPLIPFTKEQKKQLRCVADAVYFEARGESRRGQRAVATVVFNRAESSKFPNNYCAVVYQRSPAGCQFVWACQPHSISNKRVYDAILADVKDIFDLRRLDQFQDITHGSLYFSSIEPEYHSSVQIGNQHFWR